MFHKNPRIGVLLTPAQRRRLFTSEDWARLGELGDLVVHEGEDAATEDRAIELLRGCAVGLGSWGTVWPTPRVLASSPELKLWVHLAGTVKHMFTPAASERDLWIASCNDAIGANVAEFTLAALVFGLRGAFEAARGCREGAWRSGAAPLALGDATVGVIGASAVGRRVIRMLGVYGARIRVFDPYLSADDARELGVELCDDLRELCATADAVTLHTPLLPDTTRMLRAEHFRALRDGALVVNTSRGGCVDEEALIAELSTGRIFACLDVCEPEPAAPDSPLRSMPNVFLTPHIAGGATHRIGRQAVRDVAAFLSGVRPASVVSPAALARLA